MKRLSYIEDARCLTVKLFFFLQQCHRVRGFDPLHFYVRTASAVDTSANAQCAYERHVSTLWHATPLHCSVLCCELGYRQVKICAILWSYAAHNSSALLTFRNDLSIPSSKVKQPKENSALRKVPEECRSRWYGEGKPEITRTIECPGYLIGGLRKGGIRKKMWPAENYYYYYCYY